MMIREDRSIGMYILLSIITCGIYPCYFIYSIARDMNQMCEGDGKHTSGLVALILLSFLTCGIYSWYWYYAAGNRLAENAPRFGLHFEENGTTVLLWLIFGSLLCGIGIFVAMNIIIKNCNQMARVYNGGAANVQGQPSNRQSQSYQEVLEQPYQQEQSYQQVQELPYQQEQEQAYQQEQPQQELQLHQEQLQELSDRGAEKRICPSCGSAVSASAMFCRSCGKSLKDPVKEDLVQKKQCPNCGQAVEEDESFCILCGSSIVSEMISSGEVLQDENATVLMLGDEMEKATSITLRRDAIGEIILMDHMPFKLGTEEAYADYLITGNLKVSRRHAMILQEGEQYYLSDSGSSNFTFLNGEKIMENKLLRDGDVIHLADEKLTFHIG